MNPASLVVEAGKTATGRQSLSDLALWVFVATMIEAFIKRKERNMDLIYIPEGYDVWVFAILVGFALIAPLVSAMFLKNESKHAGEKWAATYVCTLIIDMLVTPSLGLIVMSLMTQAWFPELDPVSYMVILPIVLIAVAFLALKIMNEGLKATYEQVKGVAKDAQDIVQDIQKNNRQV